MTYKEYIIFKMFVRLH